VTFRLPDALAQQDDAAALGLLHRYYGEPFGSSPFTGALFDVWDSTGTRAGDADRFTADDLVAVTFLSVDTPGPAAIHVLRDRTDEFNALLAEIGPDRDMADETGPITRDWPAWRLNTRLRDLDDVGPVIASKLLARKRPRLLPIWDTVVAKVTRTEIDQWVLLRSALADHDRALHRRLLELREAAGLPEPVSALRVFDVICWMEGKDKGFEWRTAAPGTQGSVKAEALH